MRQDWIALLSGILLFATAAHAQTPAKPPAQAPAKEPSAKSELTLSGTTSKPWTGDFDGMVKRRLIRVLVPYSKTYYFVDRATPRGLVYDLTRIFENDLNKKLKTGNVRLHVVCIPVARDEMIPGLLEGKGDIAGGNLTITPERLKPWHTLTGRLSSFVRGSDQERASCGAEGGRGP